MFPDPGPRVMFSTALVLARYDFIHLIIGLTFPRLLTGCFRKKGWVSTWISGSIVSGIIITHSCISNLKK